MFWRLTFPGFLYLSAAIGPFSDNPYFFENNDERIEDLINEMLRRRQVVNHLEKYILHKAELLGNLPSVVWIYHLKCERIRILKCSVSMQRIGWGT